jgi:hypothetical protein
MKCQDHLLAQRTLLYLLSFGRVNLQGIFANLECQAWQILPVFKLPRQHSNSLGFGMLCLALAKMSYLMD